MQETSPTVAERRQRMRDERPSVPGPGRSLSGIVEQRAVHIRRAVRILEDAIHPASIETEFTRLFAPRWEVLLPPSSNESVVTRGAWAITNIWLLARISGAIGPDANLAEAEQWFLGVYRDALPSLAGKLPAEAERQAVSSLTPVVCDQDFRDLLPYMLEPHGPGSRLSVMRDPGTLAARKAKKRSGAFYTPADVAEYMVERALSEHEPRAQELRCLDPSCGTGVFLRAQLQTAARLSNGDHFDPLHHAVRCLYGFDISPLAVEACAFVLLDQCLSQVVTRGIAPWCAWHVLRMNLAALDALKVTRETSRRNAEYHAGAHTRDDIRAQLLDPSNTRVVLPRWTPPRGTGPNPLRASLAVKLGYLSLESIYPEISEGFDLLIGNPPYASLGRREDAALLYEEYASFHGSPVTGSENTYPLFVEMMWRLTRPGRSVSTLIVPLSIAYHRGRQYVACRQSLASQGGRLFCAFFDREPHALFGEDVKTRNAILVRRERDSDPPRGRPAEIETGPLRKWTSRTRENLFSSITFTPLGPIGLARGIPKLDGKEQAEAFALLSARADAMSTLWLRARTCRPIEACRPTVNPRVFVASTAYNFLNVFRWLPAARDLAYELTANTVLSLEFTREELANLAFAILSSRLIFWLWHAQGDGFHVPAWFVQRIPFGRSSFNGEQASALEHYGGRLWQVLQDHRIMSINRGRLTVGYRPLSCERERDAIDKILIEAAGIPKSFIDPLRAFIRRTVVVDETDDRRRHLKTYFDSMEDAQ